MEEFDFNHELLAVQDELFYSAYKLTGDRDEAKDLLQETLLKALDNRDKFIPSINFKGWLYVIMRNIFINQYYARASHQHLYILSDPAYEPLLEDDSHFMLVDNRYDAKEIREVLRSLPPENYIAFMMYVSGYKYREIAEITGASIGTVKSRIFHCRKKLKRLLKDFL